MKTSTKVLITISVVLNVLFLGFYLGNLTHGCKRKMHTMHFKKNFSPELRGKIGTLKKDARAYIHDVENTRKEIFEILTAEDFDPFAYDSAVGKLQQCRGEMMCSMSDRIREIAVGLNQEQRKEFAELLRSQFSHRSHWKFRQQEEKQLSKT